MIYFDKSKIAIEEEIFINKNLQFCNKIYKD